MVWFLSGVVLPLSQELQRMRMALDNIQAAPRSKAAPIMHLETIPLFGIPPQTHGPHLCGADPGNGDGLLLRVPRAKRSLPVLDSLRYERFVSV